MNVLPAVDVQAGRVVRLTRGDFSSATTYGNDPAAMARRWHEEGATLVHVVDLDGARHGLPSLALWESIAATGVPFQAGGGMRSVAAARQVIAAGAARVVVGSVAVWAPSQLIELVGELGADRVVVAVDVREGKAVGSGWQDEGRPLEEVLEQLRGAEVARVLLTSIARDGMLDGPDLDLLGRVKGLAPDFWLIASGGISSLADLLLLRRFGIGEAVVGRALYEGRFSMQEALAVASGDRRIQEL